MTCSLVFVSGQGAKRVLDDYVAHELAPFGALFHAEVRGREVVATALGVPRARAVFRPGLGCTQHYGGAPLASLPGADVETPDDEYVSWPN